MCDVALRSRKQTLCYNEVYGLTNFFWIFVYDYLTYPLDSELVKIRKHHFIFDPEHVVWC